MRSPRTSSRTPEPNPTHPAGWRCWPAVIPTGSRIFPDEAETIKRVQEVAWPRIDFAGRLLSYWVQAGVWKNSELETNDISFSRKLAALMLDVRASRQLRAILDLSARADKANATILLRSMFEGVLAMNFVLLPRFVPRHFDDAGKATKPKFRYGRGGSEFRACLYLAYHDTKSIDLATSMQSKFARTPGLIRVMSENKKNLSAGDSRAVDWKKHIGSDWLARFARHPRTYSGLSIADQSKSTSKDFGHWYEIIYRHQCRYSHATDAVWLLRESDDGLTNAWHDDVGSVKSTVELACALFICHIDVFLRHFCIWSTAAEDFSAMLAEHQELLKDA